MEKEKLLLIISNSRYDSLGNYLIELGNSLEKMGYEVDYVDGRKDNYEEKLYKKSSDNDYLAVIACNAILTGYDKLVLKDSIFCCLMFDHPVYHYERINIADEQVLIVNCDLKNAEYIAQYCPNVGSVGFIPLSGSFVEDIIPYKERKYDLVFMGSYSNSKQMYDEYMSKASDSDAIVAEEIINIMKSDVSLTMQEAMKKFIIRQKATKLSDRDFYKLMFQLRFVDSYMKVWIREQVIRSIVDSGIKIHIFGSGWDIFECEYPENLIIMEGNRDEALKALANAKIALNIMPWFRGGFQERIASGMLCGAVALTDTSSYIEENFTDNVDIAIYDAQNPDTIPKIIRDLLNDPDKAEKIATAGYDKAHKYHTWYNRATELMECIHDTVNWRNEMRNV